jgi:hypothetical protein
MADGEDFGNFVARAQKVEENALGPQDYTGTFEIKRAIDFAPEAYVTMDFDGLVNSCDRIEKIIKASQLGIYAVSEKAAPEVKAKTEAVEEKVKEITTESLTKIEEMKREEAKAPEIKAPEEVSVPSFEFEGAEIARPQVAETKEETEEAKPRPKESEDRFEREFESEFGKEGEGTSELPKAEETGKKEVSWFERLGEKPAAKEEKKEELKEEAAGERETEAPGFEFEKPPEKTEEAPEEKKAPRMKGEFAFEKPAEKAGEEEKAPPEITEAEVEKPAAAVPEVAAAEKPKKGSLAEALAKVKEARAAGAPGREKKEIKPLQRAMERMRERKGLPPLPKAPEVPEAVEAPATRVERPAVPPVLAAPSPEKETAFEKVERAFATEWEGGRDEVSIKRKMLELTKELFREKSFNRREELKRQISVLKNMLAEAPGKPAAAKGKKKDERAEKFDYSTKLFNTLTGMLATEFSNSVETLNSSAEKQVAEAREKLRNALVAIPEGDSAGRKTAFDKFVFDLTKINEQFAMDAAKMGGTLSTKHLTAIRQYETSLDPADENNLERATDKEKEVQKSYTDAIAVLKAGISQKTNAMIDATSHGIFASSAAEAAPTKKGLTQKQEEEIVLEIESMDECSLLYYLHSRDANTYKDFERKHITKSEAVTVARRRLAKEKGLSESAINKHWGS